MQFVININVDNDAFGDNDADRDSEVALILATIGERVAFGIADDCNYQTVFDVNGQ